MLHTVKNTILNLVTLSLESLHALHEGFVEELRIIEQQALTSISEFKVKNQKVLVEKTHAMKEKEVLQACSSCLESVVVEACKSIHKLHILDDAQLESKVRKSAAGVGEAREKIG